MPLIEIRNIGFEQVSTTIGLLEPNYAKPVTKYFDVVPKQLIEELEKLRQKSLIVYIIVEDPGLPNSKEAQKAVAAIGSPTTGPFGSGIHENMSIADAIQALSTASGIAVLGNPTAGDYTAGLPTVTPTTKIADAFQAFGLWNVQAAPPQPNVLTGQSLVLAGTSQFTAKIPSGLGSNWSLLTPGQSIANLIVDGTFTLTTPDSTARFRAGFANSQASAGQLSLLEAGAIAETYDIATFGIGTIGRITISSLAVYNGAWQKANALATLNLSSDGRSRFALSHSSAGLSAESEFYFDNTNTAPSFSTPLSVSVNATTSKFLSGIEALGVGSIINIGYVAASGIFNKAYHPTMVGQVTGPAHSGSVDNPSSVPAATAIFTVSRTLTLDVTSQNSLTPQYSATLRKPSGLTAISSNTLAKPVNTYSSVSTNKDDRFLDEDRRVVLNSGTSSGTATPWNSSSALTNGNAQQRHDGTLSYPNITDYPGFTGNQEYQRFISKDSASNGALSFLGILFSTISPFGTGDINVLIHLTTQNLFFDLGSSIGAHNGDGSGSSRSNSIGARNDSLSTSGTLAWSIGVNSTAANGDEYRLIVIFRNNTQTLTRITEA